MSASFQPCLPWVCGAPELGSADMVVLWSGSCCSVLVSLAVWGAGVFAAYWASCLVCWVQGRRWLSVASLGVPCSGPLAPCGPLHCSRWGCLGSLSPLWSLVFCELLAVLGCWLFPCTLELWHRAVFCLTLGLPSGCGTGLAFPSVWLLRLASFGGVCFCHLLGDPWLSTQPPC